MLVIVLLFMVMFSLILAALITNASTNLRNTVGVRNQESKVYAADAGIDWGLQQIRTNNTICVSPELTPTPQVIGTPSFNGQTTTVTCKVMSGSATGANGWAVITTDRTPLSFVTPPPASANFVKTINGPVLVGGFQDGLHHVTVNNGDVYEYQSGSTCATDTDKPEKLTVAPSPPYRYHCTTLDPVAVADAVPHELPTSDFILGLPVRDGNPDPGLSTADCNVFLPGRYTSLNLPKPTEPVDAAEPVEPTKHYFVSGVYYFDIPDDPATPEPEQVIEVRRMELVGGSPRPGESAQLTGCAADPAGTTGTGVKFILGGSSAIRVRNPAGQMELFGRAGGNAAEEGTQGVTIQTVPASAPAGYNVSSLGPGQLVLEAGVGNTPFTAIHGLVYTPNAGIKFDASNEARAWLLGGVVAARLSLSQQATIDGVRVQIDTSDVPRQLILTSRVTLADEVQAVATAVVIVAGDTTRTATVQSWRTECQVPDPALDLDDEAVCPRL